MKTLKLFATIVAILFATVTITAAAGQKPPTAGAPKVSAPKASAPKVAAPKASAPKTTAKAPKNASAKSTAKASGGKGNSAKKSTTTASTSTTTTETGSGTGDNTGTGDGTTPAPAEPNAISMKISSNPGLSAKVQSMLPQGMTLEAATAGFRNQGQFLAALNASKNQNLDFAALQTAMTKDGLSLGQAIQKVKNTPPAPTTPPQDEQ